MRKTVILEAIVFGLIAVLLISIISMAVFGAMFQPIGDDGKFMKNNPHTSAPDTAYLLDSSGLHQITTPAGVRIIVEPSDNP
jgi:hypothetical protein